MAIMVHLVVAILAFASLVLARINLSGSDITASIGHNVTAFNLTSPGGLNLDNFNFTGIGWTAADIGSYLDSINSSTPTNDTHIQYGVLISSAVMTPLSILVIVLRIYVRIQNRGFGRDDGLMIAAGVFLVPLLVFSILGQAHGIGRHITNLGINNENALGEEARHLMKVIILDFYGIYFSQVLVATFVRLAILAQYLRIFTAGSCDPWMRKLIYVYTTLSILMAIVSIFDVIFICIPVNSTWDWTVKRSSCIHIQTFFYAESGLYLALDIAICALPIKKLLKLNMKRSKRFQLILLFLFAGFGCLCSVGRLTQLKGLETNDITYSGVMGLYWTIIQTNTAAICACIPISRPAFVLLWGKLRKMASTLQSVFTSLRNMLTDIWGLLTDLWSGLTGLWSGITSFWNAFGGLWSEPTDHAFIGLWTKIASLWRPAIRGQVRWPAARVVIPRPNPRPDAGVELDEMEPAHFRWARSRTTSTLGSIRQADPEEGAGFV